MPDNVNTDDLRADANESWKPWSEDLERFKSQIDAAIAEADCNDWGFHDRFPLWNVRIPVPGLPAEAGVQSAWNALALGVAGYFDDGRDILRRTALTLLNHALTVEEAEGASQEELLAIAQEIEGL